MPYLLRVQRSPEPLQGAADLATLLPAIAMFAAILPLLQFLYMALGSLAWPVSTTVLCLGTGPLLPLLAIGSGRARQGIIAAAGVLVASGALITLALPTYSIDWPERINIEYWYDADTGRSHYLAVCDSLRLPAALAAAAHFEPVPRPRFAGGESLGFYAARRMLCLPRRSCR